MDLSLAPQQITPAADINEPFSLAFLLERGLENVQQGYYSEGVALFALARERLLPSQMQLADVLDAFIQGYARYQHLQHVLQEASTRFAEAYVDQQVRVAPFVTAMQMLLRDIDTSCCLHSLPPDPKNHQSSAAPLPYQPPQDNQSHSASLTPLLHGKNYAPLPELSITCFGHFEVRRLGELIVLCSSRNGQSILRYLVAQPGHSATSDTLQTILWPEDEAEVAQRKLHIAISALRRSLSEGSHCGPDGSYIVCKNHVYHLNPAVLIRTDVDEFLHCYQAGQQESEERVAFYERACHLYTGPFLTEDIYADWSFLQRERLSLTYLTICSMLANHYLKIQYYEDAAKWATAILKENHCDEAAHGQLIQIYAAQGRRSEAIRQYQRCERILREELGVQPLPETMLLFQTLLTNESHPNQE